MPVVCAPTPNERVRFWSTYRSWLVSVRTTDVSLWKLDLCTFVPLVSIVVPCYNAAPFVGATLASLQAQTLTDWEAVVVDDGSRDGSAEAVAPFLADPRIRLHRQANGGVARARNAGYERTQDSRYVHFLDADDVLAPQMLGTLTAFLNERADAGLAFCDFEQIDEAGTPLREQWQTERHVPTSLWLRSLPDHVTSTPYPALVIGAIVIPSVVVMRRSAFEEAGPWDETFGQPCEDTLLFLSVARRHACHYVPERLVGYRKHGQQSTASEDRLERQWGRLLGTLRAQAALLDRPERHAMAKTLDVLEYRMPAQRGLRAAARHLRRGQVAPALRFGCGAARLWLKSLL